MGLKVTPARPQNTVHYHNIKQNNTKDLKIIKKN